MTTLEIVALVAVAGWLAVLSIGVLLLIREVGVLVVRLERGAFASASGEDGLIIGSAVPETALELIGGPASEPLYLVLLSAGCRPCRELAADLENVDFDERVVAAVSGKGRSADTLLELLPDRWRTVRGGDAQALAESLQTQTTPFAYQIEGNRITGKAVLRGAADLAGFAAARGGGHTNHAKASAAFALTEVNPNGG